MSNYRIMIVEDEEVVTADILMSVEKMGHTVCATASSGLGAIQKAESIRPDLILMDINLKGNMDGIEAATRIKELYQIPVVYLTSLGKDAVMQRAKLAEPYGYITKPFVDRDLHIAIEITIYKKQAEMALRESEKKYRMLSENTLDTVWTTDLEFNMTYINKAVFTFLGYSPEEFLGLNPVIFTTPESMVAIQAAAEKLYSSFKKGNLEQTVFEVKQIKKDGTVIDVEITANLYLNDEGNVEGFRGRSIDITERKQAEKALMLSHERFFTVLNSLDATIYVADMETYEILFMNKYMIESFGRNMTGEICWDVFRKESGPCPYCTNDRLIDKDGKPTGVCNWQNKNSITEKLYNNYDRAIEWTDGRLVRLQIATDITTFKKMEAQLQQAQKMESIGTLAGGIAHDFNNILSPILGYTEMLLEDIPEDSPYRDNMKGIYTSALRAKDLVKQILTFSRQESGELMLMKMQPIVKEALKLIRSTIPTIIEIIQDINPDCGVIKADPTQIHQIVMNLATNAYHAMEETGGELKVSIKQVELGENDIITPDMTPGAYACLIIADTGVGMDKKLTDKIFDPFFTTKKIGKGTGMGLSVVHGIVTAMGGSIHVYSEPEKGTEFHVYLPIEKSFSEIQVTQATIPIKGGTEHILFVDDEELILTMEKQMLERLGYQITSRTSSVEALRAFRKNPHKFDMVITDMAMPNMSGDKLAIKLIKIRPDIPVLLCTGFSETMSKEKALFLGIKGFLLKPIIMKDLAQKIREVLDEN